MTRPKEIKDGKQITVLVPKRTIKSLEQIKRPDQSLSAIVRIALDDYCRRPKAIGKDGKR